MTLTGKTVNFTRGGEEFSARVLSVDDDARLVVQWKTGARCGIVELRSAH